LNKYSKKKICTGYEGWVGPNKEAVLKAKKIGAVKNYA